jgi:predicted enzyme related to lactoylglutathione lyase
MNIGYSNLFCWFDLHTPDKNLSRFFYETVFGWSFEDHNVGEASAYTGLSHADKAFGGVEPLPIDQASQWIGYVGVEDFEDRFAALEALGAEVMLEGINVPDLGKIGVLRDPFGALFALLEPADKENLSWLPRRGHPGDLDWAELNSDNLPAALEFYSAAFGWTFSKDAPESLGDYRFILRDGVLVGGIRQRPPEVSHSGWHFYGNVEDVRASLDKATGLNATLLLEREVPEMVHFALLTDPKGATIGIARGA